MHEQLQFRKVYADILQARKEAEEEYSEFFKVFHSYIRQSTSNILREYFAVEGAIGYFIRVDIEAPESAIDIMRQWVEALNAGILPLTYEDAIQHVKDECERYKISHGEYPTTLYINREIFRALHGNNRSSVMVPMLPALFPVSYFHDGALPPDASINMVQVLPEL